MSSHNISLGLHNLVSQLNSDLAHLTLGLFSVCFLQVIEPKVLNLLFPNVN